MATLGGTDVNDEMKVKIVELTRQGNAVAIVDLIEHNYEFDCPSFVYAGPPPGS